MASLAWSEEHGVIGFGSVANSCLVGPLSPPPKLLCNSGPSGSMAGVLSTDSAP